MNTLDLQLRIMQDKDNDLYIVDVYEPESGEETTVVCVKGCMSSLINEIESWMDILADMEDESNA